MRRTISSVGSPMSMSSAGAKKSRAGTAVMVCSILAIWMPFSFSTSSRTRRSRSRLV